MPLVLLATDATKRATKQKIVYRTMMTSAEEAMIRVSSVEKKDIEGKIVTTLKFPGATHVRNSGTQKPNALWWTP
jgi:hypothetical protein